jgi:hypothetical protein
VERGSAAALHQRQSETQRPRRRREQVKSQVLIEENRKLYMAYD